MDWGSVFASGLLGTAKAVESLADDRIKQDNADQAMLRKLQLEDAMAQAKSQRDATAMDAAYSRGEQMGADRRFNKFLQDVGPTDASREELKAAFTEYYDGIEGRYTDKASDSARDVLNAARTSGVGKEGLQSLRDEYKSALTSEQQAKVAAAKEEKERLDREQRDRMEEGRNTRAENALQASEDRQARALAAMAARGAGRGSGDKPPENERISVLKDVYGKMIANMPQPKDFKNTFGEIDKAAYDQAVLAWEQTTAGKTASQTLRRIYEATGMDEEATQAVIASVQPPAKPAAKNSAATHKKGAQQSTKTDNQATGTKRTAKVGDTQVVNGVTWVRTAAGWKKQ